MKSTELRLNNKVYLAANNNEEIMVCLADLADTSILAPIPLTEEWTNKLGVIPQYTEEYYEQEVYFDGDNNKWMYVISREYDDHGCEYYIEREVKYVHDVQNLHYVLEGEELTIKK